jgi:DNA-binding NarL/FixJ family response regulator
MAKRSRPVRVLVADDHAYTRAGVRSALEAAGFEVSAEAATGRGAVEAAVSSRPDIALLDVHMPGGNGIEAAAEIRRLLPDTAVVMLSFSREDSDLIDAVRAGAAGYVLKDADPGRLPQALRDVLAGDAVLPRSAMAALAGQLAQARPRRSAAVSGKLTGRERAVAELLREGAGTDGIAEALGMSPATVRVHIKRIMDKLDVGSRSEAVERLRELAQR